MKSPSRVVIAGIVAFVTVAAVTSGVAAADKTVIHVAGIAPGADQAAYDAFLAREATFEKANPMIDIIGDEYTWNGQTFAAQIAGGSLPAVFTVPFTETKTLLENGQLADITSEVKALGYDKSYNPIILDAVLDENGNIFGLPYEAYAMGLHYNRALFRAAGLDPDSPPTTWDEVRAAARAITEATGEAGFATMTYNNTGGWQLTAQTVAHGGRTQVDNGDGTYTSTINNPGTVAALKFIKALRWEDNSMGSNFLLDWPSINQAFAAGQVGMYTQGADVYNYLVSNTDMNPDDYGLTVIPTEGDNAGALGGGAVAVISPSLSADEQAAAVKWIDFYYLKKFFDEATAKDAAKALADADQAVGTPSLPILDKASFDQYQGWIAEFVNVPVDQMSGYFDGIFQQTPVGEAKGKTQEIYALLDAVVQAVLTDKNADIDALLTQADVDAQAILDAH
jgi:ABC-type glycerol-3-phosphate transport system substrate-binding protein